MLVVTALPALAQTPGPSPRQLFDQACQTCHGNAQVPRAADPAVLRQMSPERIYGVLTTGVMQAQGQTLSDQAKRAIAEYLSDRKLGASESGAAGADAESLRAIADRAPRAVAQLERVGREPREHQIPARGGRRPAGSPGAALDAAVGVCAAGSDGGLWPADGGGRPRLRGRGQRLRVRPRSTHGLRALGVPGPGRCAERRDGRPPAGGAGRRLLRRSQGQRLRGRCRHGRTRVDQARGRSPAGTDHCVPRAVPRSPLRLRGVPRGGRRHQPALSLLHVPWQRRALRAAAGDVAWKTYTIAEPPAPRAYRPQVSRCTGHRARVSGTRPPSIRGATRCMSAPATTTRGPQPRPPTR